MISAEGRNSPTTRPQPSGFGQAVIRGVLLAACCLVSYAVITHILVAARIVTRDDELLGGMWAVIATIFVFRFTYQESVTAALSRMSATVLSFALCFLYLLLFPFRPWGLAALIGIGAILLSLIGRPGDIITASITTAVVMVAAGISPQHAWKEPILRLIDTVVGIGVGIAGVWIGRTFIGHSLSRAPAELREVPPSKL